LAVNANKIAEIAAPAQDGMENIMQPGEIRAVTFFGGTQALGINPAGAIMGIYTDANPGDHGAGNHGFLRARDGTFTTFNPPGPINIFAPTSFGPDLYINPAGAITGSFNDGFNINHGFLRVSDGTLTTFDVPGAGTGPLQATAPLGITPAGEIMGLYVDANRLVHGFLFLPRPFGFR
jgi:hypothetical protein